MGGIQIPKEVGFVLIILGALYIGWLLMTGDGVGCDRVASTIK